MVLSHETGSQGVEAEAPELSGPFPPVLSQPEQKEVRCPE